MERTLKEVQPSLRGSLLSDAWVIQQSVQSKSLIVVVLCKSGAVFSFSFKFYLCVKQSKEFTVTFLKVWLIFFHSSKPLFDYAFALKYSNMSIHFFH